MSAFLYLSLHFLIAFMLSAALNFGIAKAMKSAMLPNRIVLGLVPLLLTVPLGLYVWIFVWEGLYPWVQAGMFILLPLAFFAHFMASAASAKVLKLHTW